MSSASCRPRRQESKKAAKSDYSPFHVSLFPHDWGGTVGDFVIRVKVQWFIIKSVKYNGKIC